MSGDASKQVRCSFYWCNRFASEKNKLTYRAEGGKLKVLGYYCDTHFSEIFSVFNRNTFAPSKYGKQFSKRRLKKYEKEKTRFRGCPEQRVAVC